MSYRLCIYHGNILSSAQIKYCEMFSRLGFKIQSSHNPTHCGRGGND